MSFVVYALPRSRTYWLSKFLNYADWHCDHDAIKHMRGLDDVRSWFSQPHTGSVETAAAPFWRLVPPDTKIVVIRRDVDDVVKSMVNTGFIVDQPRFRAIMVKMDLKLAQIVKRVPNVLAINYADLAHEETCKTIFEYVLPYAHDHEWWASMSGLNIQQDLRQTMRYYQAHLPQLTKLAEIAGHRIVTNLSAGRPLDRDDGIVLTEDSFDDWQRDAQQSLSDHLARIGDAPTQPKNWTMMRELNQTGKLQIVSARCNGRVFGYLFSMISPSLESTRMTALNCAYYASPEFPGLGMRLQRDSIRRLREKGIEEAFFYAGVRADGPRLGTMYRRIGATDFGRIYKMELAPK